MRFDERVIRAQKAYEDAREGRIELMRKLYNEGWSVAEIKESFGTSISFVQQSVPEAFDISYEDKTYIKSYNLGTKKQPIYKEKDRTIKPKEPDFNSDWLG